jgi:hypothetical protein
MLAVAQFGFLGALFGFLGVALGAFGAHGLGLPPGPRRRLKGGPFGGVGRVGSGGNLLIGRVFWRGDEACSFWLSRRIG